jgi:acetyl esterase/lipase
MKGVVDTLVVAGQREILIEDIVSWCCKVEDEGARVKLHIGQAQVHCYPMNKMLCVGSKGLAKSEYERACRRIADWLVLKCV